MIEITQEVPGATAVIRVPENGDDVERFDDWIDKQAVIAVDTETTGLDIFSEDFRVRTLQVGRGLESWVIPVEVFGWDEHDIQGVLGGRDLIFQNAAYDVLAIRRYYGVELDWDRITDTKILAHLVDPRSKREGGKGHSLQDLTESYLSPEIAEEVKGSMSALSKQTKLKKSELFSLIDVWNETYLRYAGMDVVLTWGLYNVLTSELDDLAEREPRFNRDLVRYEHEIARVCAEMSWNGFKIDLGYAKSLVERLEEEKAVWEALALVEYGVESVASSDDVAGVALDHGFTLTERTASGKYKMDKEILEGLAENGFKLADYVLAAKSAGKKASAWVTKFIEDADTNGRVHASINPLAARTARMSVTGVPAQQLPSQDWEIRRCFIADEGNSIVACDYQAQELRVLAALSNDKNMQKAFADGADLHQITADASGVERRVGKTVNFAYVYGSGAGNIAKTCGISRSKAREVIEGFERSYPGVKRLYEKLVAEANEHGYIVTPSGRVLPVSEERPWAALNYMIQSTSRDITAAALLRLDEEGFTPFLRLPIHDEVIAEVPEEYSEWGAERISSIMQTVFAGVLIDSDHEVYGRSWGGGYVDREDPDDVRRYEATFKS